MRDPHKLVDWLVFLFAAFVFVSIAVVIVCGLAVAVGGTLEHFGLYDVPGTKN